jgi:hypothetical protein
LSNKALITYTKNNGEKYVYIRNGAVKEFLFTLKQICLPEMALHAVITHTENALECSISY